MTEKFVDRAKQELFYEYEGGNDNVRLMVSQSAANSRVNEQMARWEMSVLAITSSWHGKWQNMFEPIMQQLETHFLNLNGYSRVQAIEMAGQASVGQREVIEPKERGGLLGLFSGKK